MSQFGPFGLLFHFLCYILRPHPLQGGDATKCERTSRQLFRISYVLQTPSPIDFLMKVANVVIQSRPVASGRPPKRGARGGGGGGGGGAAVVVR